jgi:hypothetical protein
MSTVPANGFEVEPDVLREYGTYCVRQGDDVNELSKALRADGAPPALTWYGGHMTHLLQLQQALDEMRDVYSQVLWATSHRLARIAGALLDTGATLHKTAERYEETDRTIADWMRQWP